MALLKRNQQVSQQAFLPTPLDKSTIFSLDIDDEVRQDLDAPQDNIESPLDWLAKPNVWYAL